MCVAGVLQIRPWTGLTDAIWGSTVRVGKGGGGPAIVFHNMARRACAEHVANNKQPTNIKHAFQRIRGALLGADGKGRCRGLPVTTTIQTLPLSSMRRRARGEQGRPLRKPHARPDVGRRRAMLWHGRERRVGLSSASLGLCDRAWENDPFDHCLYVAMLNLHHLTVFWVVAHEGASKRCGPPASSGRAGT